MGRVQLIFLGIIGEYLGRIYGDVKEPLLYVIEHAWESGEVQIEEDRRIWGTTLIVQELLRFGGLKPWRNKETDAKLGADLIAD